MKRNGKLSASLHALVHMAERPERPMTSEEIASWLHTNPVVVRRMVAGLRDAGILSSAGELRYSVLSREPQRIRFDLERMMRTRYKIDSYQATYFVIDSFEQLFEATAPDFTPIYASVAHAGELEATARVAGDRPC